MARWMLLLLGLTVHICSAADSSIVQGRACSEGARLVFVAGGVPSGCQAVAQAAYVDQDHTASSFGKLRIVASDPAVPAVLRYQAAGFLEGWLTAPRIWQHYNNMRHYFETQLYPGVDLWGEPMQWLKDQEAWLRAMIEAAHNREDQTTDKNGDRLGTRGTQGATILSSHGPRIQIDRGAGTGSTKGAAPPQDDSPLSTLLAVELMLAQFDGLVEGYAARREEEGKQGGGSEAFGPMLREHHMFMQNNGELYDIVDGWLAGAWGNHTQQPEDPTAKSKTAADRAVGQARAAAKAARRQWLERWRSPRQAAEWLRDVSVAERCSALIKVTGDLSDILIGHATWDSYTNMLRIYKHYDLGSPGFGRLSFSSYPGETFSDDDFYLSESGLVVLETTNHLFNPDIFRVLSPHTLLSWQRVRSAMLLANSGDKWVQVFSYLNSGTYNNQYMVLDLNRFQPKVQLLPGLLWVVEQLPGLVVAQDVTDALARGYWGSYNVPFFQQVYNQSGYPDVLSAMLRDQEREQDRQEVQDFDVPISWLRYQSSPRAAIFRRDQSAADTLDKFKDLIRYNDYQHDQYSHGFPQAAICSRGDLEPMKHRPATLTTDNKDSTAASRRLAGQASEPRRGKLAKKVPVEPKGCYDGKVTSAKLARQLVSEVVSGPTTSHGLPVFSWSGWDDSYGRIGHASSFNFTWERMAATDLSLSP